MGFPLESYHRSVAIEESIQIDQGAGAIDPFAESDAEWNLARGIERVSLDRWIE